MWSGGRSDCCVVHPDASLHVDPDASLPGQMHDEGGAHSLLPAQPRLPAAALAAPPPRRCRARCATPRAATPCSSPAAKCATTGRGSPRASTAWWARRFPAPRSRSLPTRSSAAASAVRALRARALRRTGVGLSLPQWGGGRRPSTARGVAYAPPAATTRRVLPCWLVPPAGIRRRTRARCDACRAAWLEPHPHPHPHLPLPNARWRAAGCWPKFGSYSRRTGAGGLASKAPRGCNKLQDAAGAASAGCHCTPAPCRTPPPSWPARARPGRSSPPTATGAEPSLRAARPPWLPRAPTVCVSLSAHARLICTQICLARAITTILQ
jgi:hypothetical protein